MPDRKLDAMLRLFAGIEIPKRQRDSLGLVSQPLPGAKWVEPDNMHLTLRFAGDIDNRIAEEFAAFLAEIDSDPFTIRIADLGCFGGNDPKVIWAGVNGGDRLEALQRATERAARSAGLPPETRSYKPHITLARLRGTRPEAVARFLSSAARLDLEPFTVERFVLFSSRPRVGGGPYVVEDAYPMRGTHWD